MQIESTAGSSPTTTRAPRLACRMRSQPLAQRASPGPPGPAPRRSGSLRASTTPASYLAPAQATRGRSAGQSAPRRPARVDARGGTGAPGLAARTASASERTATVRIPGRALGCRGRDQGAGEAEPGGLGQPAGRPGTWRTSPASPTSPNDDQVGRERPAHDGRGQGQGQAAGRRPVRRPGCPRPPRRTDRPGRPAPRPGTRGRPAPGPGGSGRRPGRCGGRPPARPPAGQGLQLDQQGPAALEERGHGAARHLGPAVPEQERPGIARRRRMPSSPISNRPTSPVGPKRCLTARRSRSGVVAVALDDQHRVDQVLERPGPGQVAVLGDVADQDERRALAPWPAGPAARRRPAPGPRTPAARRPAGSATVWIESTTTRSGPTVATASLDRGQVEVADTERVGGSGPRRAARARTWVADSSAETSSVVRPPAEPRGQQPGAAGSTCRPRARRRRRVTDPAHAGPRRAPGRARRSPVGPGPPGGGSTSAQGDRRRRRHPGSRGPRRLSRTGRALDRSSTRRSPDSARPSAGGWPRSGGSGARRDRAIARRR